MTADLNPVLMIFKADYHDNGIIVICPACQHEEIVDRDEFDVQMQICPECEDKHIQSELTTEERMEAIKAFLKLSWGTDGDVEDLGACSIIGKDLGLKGGLFKMNDSKRGVFYIALSVKDLAVDVMIDPNL